MPVVNPLIASAFAKLAASVTLIVEVSREILALFSTAVTLETVSVIEVRVTVPLVLL